MTDSPDSGNDRYNRLLSRKHLAAGRIVKI
jgi:hypothetical protein